jgi:alkylated DNA nucleotide flippase Atl1
VVKATETNLAGVLEGKKQYQVPLYQRTYSWGKKQLDQLWSDVTELAQLRQTDPTATHFIGSLVLATSPDFAVVGVSKLLVVDGQQRLTTLTLLLAALRDHLIASGDPERAEGVQAQYLLNVYDKGKPTKVLPTQADRAAYLAVVHSAPDAGSSGKVGEAYNHFRSKIAAADDPDDPHDLEEIENAVVRGLALVVVTAEASDNAHRIFESLNNTGLQLNQSDLLKNYLFMRLGDKADVVYDSVWLPLEKKLSAATLELLFWLDLVQTDERATQSDTYVGQQKRLEKLKTAAEIEAEIHRIAKLGDVLATILDPARESNSDVRKRLTRIKAWGSTTAYPVVMRLLDRRAAGTATTEQVVNALILLESFFVRRIVIGRATANLNRTLLQAVGAIADAESVDVALRTYLSHGRKYFATDKQVRDAVNAVPFYWQGRAAQKKLILQWLEESYDYKEAVDPTNLTIEHVLPQTLTDAARETFAAGLPDGADVTYEHERIVHTLGNLTLSGYNSELSNKVFAAKRPMLAESGLRMNQEIAKNDIWGTVEIHARSSELAERIIGIWPGPDETLIPSRDDEPSALRAVVASIVAEIPAGRWTSYGEVALVAGSYPQPVAAVIATYPMPNAWRVLQSAGSVSPGFRWSDANRTDDPKIYLESEGLLFDDAERASTEQFIDASQLAAICGLDVDEDGWRSTGSSSTTLADQQVEFFQQVRDLGEATGTVVKSWPKALRQHWLNISIGSGRAHIGLTISSRTPTGGCELYISNDKQLYAELHAQRAEIESAIGGELDWQELPTRKASRVFLQGHGDFRDPDQAPQLAQWLVTTAERFAEVFPRYL